MVQNKSKHRFANYQLCGKALVAVLCSCNFPRTKENIAAKMKARPESIIPNQYLKQLHECVHGHTRRQIINDKFVPNQHL